MYAHAGSCHDRINFLLYSRSRRYQDSLVFIQFCWADILWRAYLGYSDTVALISGVLFCGILKYLMVHTPVIVEVDLTADWQLFNLKRPRSGGSVLLSHVELVNSIGELSYANSNTVDFGLFIALNTFLSPCKVMDGIVLYLLDSPPVSSPLYTTAGVFYDEYFASSV